MMTKPRLVLTRRLRPAVEQRAARDYDLMLNPDDRVLSPQDLVAA
ncbi:hypothetical protein RAH32_03460 [Paracoccus sp. WLY502]|nr:hypothetical protein [Paracoccus sp. WLY502]MDQ1899503.1 hypothetical protein [Paracoccus sp. WLY502]